MIEIEVKIPPELVHNGQVAHFLTSTFVQHIIYMRGLIPTPFVALRNEVNSKMNDAGRKLSMFEKKMVKFTSEMDLMLTSLNLVSQNHVLQSVCLLFGPSANNSKESYIL